ncbi:MAG: Tm-1-like ATP-binding domain-containing protein [Acetanaerobacterium sp.]
MEQMKTVALIATLNTKEPEVLYAKQLLEGNGCNTFIIDISTRDSEHTSADISSTYILNSTGIQLETFSQMDKATAVYTMQIAARKVVRQFFDKGRFDGILSIGGGQNAKISSYVMRGLPYGIPKLLVSPLFSGQRTMDQYIGDMDIMLMHSIVDFTGVNSVTSVIIKKCAYAMLGMLEHPVPFKKPDNMVTVGITTLGITAPCTDAVIANLENERTEVVSFHANGTGGGCMENFIRNGYIDCVFDINLHEITCELLGGYSSGSTNRLTAAAASGIPILCAPGAVDIIDYFVASDEVPTNPPHFEKRQKMYHNNNVCHTKTFKEEIVLVGKEIAHRLNAAVGDVTIVIPLGGLSEAGALGNPLYNPDVDKAFIQVLKHNLKPNIRIVEVNDHINSRACIDACLAEGKRLLRIHQIS